MKVAKAAPTEGIHQAIAKGHCPLCAVLADFQSSLLKTADAAGIGRLCNYHTWALAKAAPADLGARIFLRLVEISQGSMVSSHELNCDFCEKIRQKEITRMEEMGQQLRSTTAQEWMKLHGSFCLLHAKKLGDLLPSNLRDLVLQIVNRNRTELKEELTALLEHLRHSDRTGWGVLGRAAEFLTSQRGITR